MSTPEVPSTPLPLPLHGEQWPPIPRDGSPAPAHSPGWSSPALASGMAFHGLVLTLLFAWRELRNAFFPVERLSLVYLVPLAMLASVPWLWPVEALEPHLATRRLTRCRALALASLLLAPFFAWHVQNGHSRYISVMAGLACLAFFVYLYCIADLVAISVQPPVSASDTERASALRTRFFVYYLLCLPSATLWAVALHGEFTQGAKAADLLLSAWQLAARLTRLAVILAVALPLGRLLWNLGRLHLRLCRAVARR